MRLHIFHFAIVSVIQAITINAYMNRTECVAHSFQGVHEGNNYFCTHRIWNVQFLSYTAIMQRKYLYARTNALAHSHTRARTRTRTYLR